MELTKVPRRGFVEFGDMPAIDEARKRLFPLCYTCGTLAKVGAWRAIGDIEQYATCLMLEHDFWFPCRGEPFWIRRRDTHLFKQKWEWGKGETKNG